MFNAEQMLERIQQKIVVDYNGCWIWIGARSGRGMLYGHLTYLDEHGVRRWIGAHQASYIIRFGDVPECHVPLCVSPTHLEPVTYRENILRGDHPSAILHRAGTCKRGHPASESYRRKNGTRAYCRTCRKALGDGA